MKTLVVFLAALTLSGPRTICAEQLSLHHESGVVGEFPPDLTADIAWSAAMVEVSDIKAAFDAGRAGENAQLGTSIPPMPLLPSQTVWDSMSPGQKALWLINSERTARGLDPLQDVEANVTQVAQNYARFLFDNQAFSHTADGRDPPQRLAANPAIGACLDFLEVSENLAVFVTTRENIPLPVERSVYNWQYADAGSAWGHRHAILWFPYNDNSGPTGSEGFLGIGVVSGGPYQGPFSQSFPLATLVVMNVFDPCAAWQATTHLYFPRVINTSSERTGVAIVNLSKPDSAAPIVRQETDANLTFRAYDLQGQLIAGPNITNPAIRPLGAANQLAELFFQIFGPGFIAESAWVDVESDNDQIVGFFLFFDDAVNFLDGSDAGGKTLTEMIFTETESVELNLANPNTTIADVSLRLYSDSGALLLQRDDVHIPGMGKFKGDLSTLFPEAAPESSRRAIQQASDRIHQASVRSLRVSSNVGIVGFGRLGDGMRFIGGLNGQATGGATKLFVPQYVEGGGFTTDVSVVNLDAAATANVSLALVGEDGKPLGTTAMREILPHGKVVISDPAVFGLSTEGGTIEGYIVVTSDGAKLAGSVIFGDPQRATFETALPFVSRVQREVVYSQVAQNETFFTGAAIINLSDSALTATIDVFDTQGTLVRTGMRQIVARGRDSFVLTELFPDLNISAGYFRVRSDQDMASFAIFGTHTLSAVSAVPPQTAS